MSKAVLPALLAVVAGLSMAAAVPPAGIWPLGILGIAALGLAIRDRSVPARGGLGALAGIVLFTITLSWVEAFTGVGFVLLVLVEASFFAVAAVLAGRQSVLALAPALVLTEGARSMWPFGGLPMGGLALGQANGPLAPGARLGGHLLVVGLAAALGAALVLRGAVRTRIARGVVVGLVVLVVVVGAHLAPDGGPDRAALRVAAVQGGGERGFRKADVDPAEVLARHLVASEQLRPPLDLVLWPEDVIDVPRRVDLTEEGELVGDVAQRSNAILIAGAVEDAGPRRFRNAAVAWGPDGSAIGRYEKVHRVPFGEWVPYRSFFDRFADLGAIPRDAIPGRGAGVISTPKGRLGVLISFEVFDAGRARSAVRGGASVLLGPTNTASYKGTQVPDQETAAATLRARETGRWLVQASPTGHALIVDPNGRVLEKSDLDVQTVVTGTVHHRTGRTIYSRMGDLGTLGGAVLLLLAIRLAGWRRARSSRPSGQEPA